jgi:hypothetical protein
MFRMLSAARAAVIAVIVFALAACAQTPRNALTPSDRSPIGGREALVVVTQGELGADIVPSRAGIAGAAAAGAIPGIGILIAAAAGAAAGAIEAKIDQQRTQIAQKAVTPVRDAMTDYRFDPLALDSARATLEKMSWLGVHKTSFSKVATDASLESVLDKSRSPEVLVLSYDYALSPDFSQMLVGANVTIYAKKPPAGDPVQARLELKNARYHQVFRCEYPLAGADRSMSDNARRWAANHAAAARQALNLGLQRLSGLMQRGLGETPAEASALSRGAQITAGGESGKLIDKTGTGTLLLDQANEWVFVPNAAIG